MLFKESLDNGVEIYWNIDQKFHDYIMRYRFVFPLTEETSSYTNVLMRMMVNKVEGFESKKAFRKRLNTLYGTRVRASTYALGSHQVLEIQLRSVAEKYVDIKLLEQQVDVLEDVLYRPILDEASFKEAKTNLILEHERMQDHSREKAVYETLKMAGEGQALGISTMGDPKLVQETKLEDIIEFHQTILKNSFQSLIISGNVEKTSLQNKFQLSKSQKINNLLTASEITSHIHEEKHQGDQSELVLLFNPNIFPGDDLYLAYMVYVAYLGQFPNSVLFRKVREEHSLCYSIYASRLIFDGVMIVQTSVADDNVEKTLEIIKLIMEDSKKNIGDISSIQKALISSLDSVTESLSAMNQRIFYKAIGMNPMSIETMQARIKEITKEDLMEVARKIEEPFVYAYRGVLRK